MTSYDELPYPSYAFAQTHPDLLATVATLLGLEPAPIDRCRMLEIGCASGGNLVPLAYALPNASFVGIDLSARQVAAGQLAVAELGLSNVQLRQQDLCALGPDAGTFDYIVAHGVYSWVPPHVRDALMALVKRHLAPNGVAYVSYNTNPGWGALSGLRAMLRYHTRAAGSPSEALDRACNLVSRFAALSDEPHVPSSAILDACRSYVRHLADPRSLNGRVCTYHDILAEVNDPCLFSEFATHASRHGLQYLAEADFATVLPTNLAAPVAEQLAAISGDIVEMEQYMDFVRGRAFRRTLLVHADVHVERRLRPERLAALAVASQAAAVGGAPDLRPGVVEQFRAPNGAVLSVDSPASKAAMLCLHRSWPRPLSFTRLLDDACTLLGDAAPVGEDRARAAAVLAADLLTGFTYDVGLVELHTLHAPGGVAVAERPVASLVARYEAVRDDVVTNMRHESISLADLQRALLPYLDGTRSVADLRNILVDLVAEGRLVLEGVAAAQAGSPEVRMRIDDGLQELLDWFARSSLLVHGGAEVA